MKHRIRIRTAGLGLAVLLLASACSGTSSDTSHGGEAATSSASVGAAGDPIPLTTFETFEGATTNLESYAGRPLVVNFWASWCPSCVAEMSAAFLPAQLALGDDVAFLGMNIQDERARALELVAETGVLFDLAEDPTGALYSDLGGLGMPFTIFISADGRILETHNGPLTEDQLVDQITEVLLS